MLGKKKNSEHHIQGFISAGVEVKGIINSRESIRVDGTVDGELSIAGDLIVGEQGKIKGEVKVKNLLLAGTINGNAAASEKITITATGAIHGDVRCAALVIEEGGILSGSSKMGRETKPETGLLPVAKKEGPGPGKEVPPLKEP